ncbi:MAG: methyltransferase domain-containing protein [Methanoregulaceae archaeon]|nr:methyltransferase domain-containing protein [Methanoregulaceae archaeon]
MRLLFELSGEHPTLPVAELACVGRVIEQVPQAAVVECDEPCRTGRLALTHRVIELYGSCHADMDSFRKLLMDLSVQADVPFAGRVKKVEGSSMDAPVPDLERLIGRLVSGRVSLTRPETEYRALCSADRCFFGRVLVSPDRRSFDLRKPGDRPFFHPGVMMPRMARALVNISCVNEGEVLIDPFSGTGGILIEAALVGADPVGIDMDPVMLRGSRANAPGVSLVRADATRMPVKDRSADAVVTDLPYGQSVMIRARSMDQLYSGSIEEIARILKPGRKAVVVTHRDISATAGGILHIAGLHEQRVHRSLTRRILVLEHR